jgi:serine/threonine protein kinase
MERLLKSRYRIKEKMGEGPFSITYHGTFLEKDDPLVIKIYKRSVLSSQLIKSVKRKVKTLCGISHQNIARVIDGDYGWQGFYFVREYVSGSTLTDVLGAGKLELNRAINIIDGILSGLSACHKQGIIHGALNPNNVIIAEGDVVKLADFVIVGEMRGSMNERAEMTYFSSSFMTPEEIRGEVLSEHSDIYFAGLLLYVMLSGVDPFAGKTNLETSLKILREMPSILTTFRGDVPSYIEDVISRALEKDPLMRFKSIEGLISSLKNKRVVEEAKLPENLLDISLDNMIDSVVSEVETAPKEKKFPGKRRLSFRFALVFLVVLAAVFGLAYAIISAVAK